MRLNGVQDQNNVLWLCNGFKARLLTRADAERRASMVSGAKEGGGEEDGKRPRKDQPKRSPNSTAVAISSLLQEQVDNGSFLLHCPACLQEGQGSIVLITSSKASKAK